MRSHTTTRRFFRISTAALTLSLLAGACGNDDTASTTTTTAASSSTTDAAAVTLDDATKQQLDEAFDEAFATTGMPGAAAEITIGDATWTRSAGVDDLSTEAPFDPDGHVRIASITKTFTGNAVLQLADSGELSLDDTLEQYVTGIPNGEEITIRQLLSMTSGIWDFTSDEEFVGRFDADPMIPWTPEDTVELIRNSTPNFAPGEEVEYCDSNFVLLGLIVEKVTGQTAAEFINAEVVEPLGLDGTLFPAPDEPGVPDPHPTGYLPPEEGSDADPTVVGDINPQVAWTAGAMTSTMDDLAAWADELGSGTLLSPETQAERLQGQRFEGQKIDYGYGLGVTTLNDVVGHNGAIIGYSTAAFRYPDQDATFVVVGNESTNFTTPSMDIFLALLQVLYPDQLT